MTGDPDMADGPRIGLLGGSFNPAHEGHREISLAAIKAFNLDAVWWLVSPGNPLKDKADYAPYDERLAQARRVANHHRIVISDYERRRQITYTIDTIRSLTDELQHVRFIWLMGADSLASFHEWRDWRGIAERAPIAVFSRPGDELACETSPAAKQLKPFRLELADADAIFDATPPAWIFYPHTANEMSSTQIRRRKDA
ncbi:MAG: nicotinate-nucleotide adenylyltransferase [Alphaproteobacteria bacterium]|nr:nicotinate-nucleotide adenylyltransferase [Alphaproteobacteria bacterium]